jgi:hypothetical protein
MFAVLPLALVAAFSSRAPSDKCTELVHVHAVMGDSATCFEFNLSTLPVGEWVVYDNSSYHVPYEVAAPCASASTNLCANEVARSPAYALIGAGAPANRSTCYALGGASDKAGGLPSTAATAAATTSTLTITIPGGVGGRTLIYNLVCDPNAPDDQGPRAMDWVAERSLTYPVEWHTKAGCVSPCFVPRFPSGLGTRCVESGPSCFVRSLMRRLYQH